MVVVIHHIMFCRLMSTGTSQYDYVTVFHQCHKLRTRLILFHDLKKKTEDYFFWSLAFITSKFFQKLIIGKSLQMSFLI